MYNKVMSKTVTLVVSVTYVCHGKDSDYLDICRYGHDTDRDCHVMSCVYVMALRNCDYKQYVNTLTLMM